MPFRAIAVVLESKLLWSKMYIHRLKMSECLTGIKEWKIHGGTEHANVFRVFVPSSMNIMLFCIKNCNSMSSSNPGISRSMCFCDVGAVMQHF